MAGVRRGGRGRRRWWLVSIVISGALIASVVLWHRNQDAPSLGNEAEFGHQADVSSLGHQADVSSLGHQADVSSLGHQADVSSLGHQADVSSLGHQADVSSLGHQADVSSLGHQADVSSLGHRPELRPEQSTPEEAEVADLVSDKLSGPPHEILPGGKLYYLGSDTSYGYTAAYALRTSEGIVVVDPGLRFETLQDAFSHLQLPLAEVKVVLVTHRHADHWFGARELVQHTGAVVMAHRDEVAWLTKEADLRQYYSVYAKPIPHAPVLSEVKALDDGEVVRLGDATIETIATPGHTSGSACFLTTVDDKRVLWSGDTIVTLSRDALDGDYMSKLGPTFGGDIRAYLNSLRRLQGLQVDYLLPGHPLLGSNFASHVGEASWRGMIEQKIARVEALVAAHGRRLDQFLDGVPKALSPRLFYLGDSHSTAAYVLQSSIGLICVDPGRRSEAELRDQFQQLGLDVGDVKAVLLTGIHPDHSASARTLCDAAGAKLYCGSIEESVPAAAELSPFQPIAAMETLTLGDVEIRATAGSTGAGADLCFLARTPTELVLFGGDNVGRFYKPPSSHHPDLDKNTVANAADPAAIQFVMSQPIEFVLPAHPQLEELPFYAPGEWQARGRN